MKKIITKILYWWYRRTPKVLIVDEELNVLKDKVKMRDIPRYDELIYFEEGGNYHRVLNVIHYANDKHVIYIVVKPIEIVLKG